jgi:hypothetical protein
LILFEEENMNENIVEIKGDGDEAFNVFVNGKLVANFNHDEDGWAGMRKGEKVITKIAEMIGAEFKTDM